MMMEGRDLVMSEYASEQLLVQMRGRSDKYDEERGRGRRMMMEGRDLVMQGGNSILQVKDQLQCLPRLQALFLLFGQFASRCCV